MPINVEPLAIYVGVIGAIGTCILKGVEVGFNLRDRHIKKKNCRIPVTPAMRRAYFVGLASFANSYRPNPSSSIANQRFSEPAGTKPMAGCNGTKSC